MDGTTDRSADVLIIEDDPGDALLVMESFAQSGAARRCHVAAKAQQALAFLRRSGGHAAAPRPRLILLDLNLEGTHGLEVLAELKSDDDLKSIPVVVLSSSHHPADVARSYALHANAYMVKPVGLDDFSVMIGAIDTCFLRLAAVPEVGKNSASAPHPVIDPQGEEFGIVGSPTGMPGT
jgi:CheY-like chemotaxis protein